MQTTFIKLTEMQLYMSTSCQPGSRVILAFTDVEKPFLFSDSVVKDVKSENKNSFSTSKKAHISSRVNTQRAFGAKMTSYLRRCDVITSHRR